MIAAARCALGVCASILNVLIGIGAICTSAEIWNFRDPGFVEETKCAVMDLSESNIYKTSSYAYNGVSFHDGIINFILIESEGLLGLSKSGSWVYNLRSIDRNSISAIGDACGDCGERLTSIIVFYEERLYECCEASGRLSPRILIAYHKACLLACCNRTLDSSSVRSNPSARIGDDVVMGSGNAVSSGCCLIFGSLSKVLVDSDLRVGLARTVFHLSELLVQPVHLFPSVFMGIAEGRVENKVGGAGKDNREDKQPYRNYFMSGTLVIVGLLLSFGSLKSISYAVHNNKILFVLMAFVLQTIGIAAILYVAGFFSPFEH